MEWPGWWDWELEITPYLRKRMLDRDFSEVDLRRMLDDAQAYRRDAVEGRWVVETVHASHRWEVVVEPDALDQIVVVITAYAVDR